VNETYGIITDNTTEVYDYRVANESAIPYAIVGTSRWDSFSTDIDMGQRKIASAMRQPQWGFPFDLVRKFLANKIFTDEIYLVGR
jgi:hypothetical protein